METKRLYVGGLFSGITETDIRQRFQQFGEIQSVDIKSKTVGTGNL